MRRSGNKSAAAAETFEYVFQLFVTGTTPNSVRAVNNIRDICETHLKGRYLLQVIDVYQDPSLAMNEQLIALPLLVKKLPLPEKKLIGDLSQTEKVMKALGLA
jgi:circadian clock protein KaiB